MRSAGALGAAMLGGCDDDEDGDGGAAAAETVAIEGREFAFDGVPGELERGSYTLTFENAGAELHELVLAPLPEGVSLLEALELPGEEGPQPIGIVFAAPGTASAGSLLVDFEPGRYALVCFIENGDGPHVFQGMQAEIVVD